MQLLVSCASRRAPVFFLAVSRATVDAAAQPRTRTQSDARFDPRLPDITHSCTPRDVLIQPCPQLCRGCSWTGSCRSTCWCRCWCWRASERACTSSSPGCRTPTSGATKQSGITRWWPA